MNTTQTQMDDSLNVETLTKKEIIEKLSLMECLLVGGDYVRADRFTFSTWTKSKVIEHYKGCLEQMQNKTKTVSIFRNKDENKWSIVAFPQLHKTITRKQGLEIKNKMDFIPMSSYGVSLGYKGQAPATIFLELNN